MESLRKRLESFRNEIHGGETQEKGSIFVIDAILKRDRSTAVLNIVLIVVGLIQVWLRTDSQIELRAA